jgi:Flp pilus assembly protein TadB
MAAPKSGRHSRKRRKTGAAARVHADATADPDAAAVEPVPRSAREALRPRPRPRRSELKAEQRVLAQRQQRQRDSMTGAYGPRPENPFGGVPVSEIAILAGAVGVIYGFVSSTAAVLVVGIVVCTLGVAEFSVREHFSGYRSHTTMLAAIPAIGVGIAMIALLSSSLTRGLLLLAVVPVFVVCFWLLRKRFRVARQARIAKPPAP